MTCPQVNVMKVGEVRNCALSMLNKLRSGELLTGTPDVTATPSGLTIENESINTLAMSVNGIANAVGQVALYTVSGGEAGVTYRITVSCDTTSAPGERLAEDAILQVVD